ncbi:MAG: hypothetical protein AAGF47_05425, partial [Planctomycetota bacterium]
ARTGDAAGERPVAITVRTEARIEVGRGTAVFEPGAGRAETVVPFLVPADGDAQPLLSAAIEADGLAADNAVRMPIERRSSIRVAIVAPPGRVAGLGVGEFSPADWVRLALRPSPALADIETIDLAPAGVDAPSLSAVDAAIVLQPEGLQAGGGANTGWEALGSFARRGGLVVVFPGVGPGAQTWTDSFRSAFGLPWSLPREPVVTADDPSDPTAGIPLAATDLDDPGHLLSALAGELDDLLRGVTVRRLLPATELGDDARTLLQTEPQAELQFGSGLPVLVGSAPITETGAADAGYVVYSAVVADSAWTDLPTRPVMVPLIQEIVRQGVGLATPRPAYTAGAWFPPEGATLLDTEGRPAATPARHAGVYTMINTRGSEPTTVVVNSDTAGSDVTPIGRERLQAWLAAGLPGETRLAWIDDTGEITDDQGDAAGSLDAAEAGSAWVRWLALAALAIACIETAIAAVSSRRGLGRALRPDAAGREGGP